VIFYVLLSLFLSIFEEYIKNLLQRSMMATVKQDLLESVMKAPVNTFFDLVPTSKIQGKVNGDVWCIVGLFWWATWAISEMVRTGTTVVLIARTDSSILIALLCMLVYLYHGQ
jgi:ABC-type multidrug transport system fused ATPase/permease subunit